MEHCSSDQVSVNLGQSVRQLPTVACEKRKSRRKYTSHEHVGRKSTRRKHEVGVDEVVDGTLEDGEESKTNTGSADAETFQTGSVLLYLVAGHGTYPIQ